MSALENPRFGLTALVLMALPLCANADRMDSYQIGSHGQANIKYPTWFKESFLDLQEDLRDAKKAGKRGVIVFFSQKNCSHCQAFLDTTLGDPATQQRVRKDYDVIGLDIFNDVEVTGVDGSVKSIKNLAEAEKARLTPTLVFYGTDNTRLLKIVGFYPPEKFNRVLDYIDGAHYKQQSLSKYLHETGSGAGSASQAVKFDYTLFAKPPHQLDRSKTPGKRPLLVIFERPNCDACSRFHKRVLSDGEVQGLIPKYDRVQLDMSDRRSTLATPGGQQQSPWQWAEELQLSYDIAVVFFDEQGKEVHRLDSEAGRDRMAGSMQYVLEKAYLRHEQYLRWRREQAQMKQQSR